MNNPLIHINRKEEQTMLLKVILSLFFIFMTILEIFLYPEAIPIDKGISYFGNLHLESGNPNHFAIIFIMKIIISSILMIYIGVISKDYILLSLGVIISLVAFPYDTYPVIHDIGALFSYLLMMMIVISKIILIRKRSDSLEVKYKLYFYVFVMIVMVLIMIFNFVNEAYVIPIFDEYSLVYQILYLFLFFGILIF